MNDVAASVDVFIPINKAAEELNIPLTILKRQINDGNIKSTDCMLSKAVYDEIKAQQELYIGIGEFLKKHDSPRFDSKYAKYRDKYIDFLEENSYFGIEIVKSENILFNLPGHEDFYITKEDAQLLEYKSEEFFKDFGYTDEELVNREIESAKGHPVTCIGNLCPYHIFTSDGVPALIKVIKNYQRKWYETGNRKYEIALKTKIIPAFQNIINAVIQQMSEAEKSGTKKLIKECLNG